jgi:hypothetical protein
MKKQVRFIKVVTIYCLNDKDECRKSEWEIYARNRMWFGRKIARIEVILKPVFEKKLFEIKM